MRAILTTNARNGAELMRFKGEAPHPILLWEIGVILCIYIPPELKELAEKAAVTLCEHPAPLHRIDPGRYYEALKSIDANRAEGVKAFEGWYAVRVLRSLDKTTIVNRIRALLAEYDPPS